MGHRSKPALLAALLLIGGAGLCGAAENKGGGTPDKGGKPEDKITVASKDGQGLSVKNFKLYRTTLTRDTMPGRFILAGGLNPHGSGAAYSIFYIEPQKAFAVLILRKPVALMRERAERDLMDKLGLAKDQMCKLDCYVQVPADVDTEQMAQNLGFTFCTPPAAK